MLRAFVFVLGLLLVSEIMCGYTYTKDQLYSKPANFFPCLNRYVGGPVKYISYIDRIRLLYNVTTKGMEINGTLVLTKPIDADDKIRYKVTRCLSGQPCLLWTDLSTTFAEAIRADKTVLYAFLQRIEGFPKTFPIPPGQYIINRAPVTTDFLPKISQRVGAHTVEIEFSKGGELQYCIAVLADVKPKRRNQNQE